MLNEPLVVCGQTARRVAEHGHDLTTAVHGLRNGLLLGYVGYVFITREGESGRNEKYSNRQFAKQKMD